MSRLTRGEVSLLAHNYGNKLEREEREEKGAAPNTTCRGGGETRGSIPGTTHPGSSPGLLIAKTEGRSKGGRRRRSEEGGEGGGGEEEGGGTCMSVYTDKSSNGSGGY